jgi:hypothetical protein
MEYARLNRIKLETELCQAFFTVRPITAHSSRPAVTLLSATISKNALVASRTYIPSLEICLMQSAMKLLVDITTTILEWRVRVLPDRSQIGD